MRRPSPTPHSPRGPRYITPRRARPGEKPRRGQLARMGVPTTRTLEQLHITFLPDGSVTVPRYRKIPGTNRLVIEKYVTVRNPAAAIRMVTEQTLAIRGEGGRLIGIYRQLTGTHADIVKHWKEYDPTQRGVVISLLREFAGAIGDVKQIQREDKRRARERLEEAIGQLEKNQVGRGALQIIGVANDLIAQENVFMRQHRLLPRRGIVLEETARKYKDRLEKYIRDMLSRMDRINAPLIRPGDVETILEEMRLDYQSMSRKHENEVTGARTSLAEAGKALKKGDWKMARHHMREVNRAIVGAISKRYLLTPSLLEFVSRSAYPAHRRRIFTEQLEMLAESVFHWYRKIQGGEDPQRMIAYFNRFAAAAQRDLPEESLQLIHEAESAIAAQMPAIAIRRMELAYEIASGKEIGK